MGGNIIEVDQSGEVGGMEGGGEKKNEIKILEAWTAALFYTAV